MSNGTTVFREQRSRIQELRRVFEHREEVNTAIRMVHAVLDERADRLARDVVSARSDDELLDHLDRLLSFHEGSPNLGYLQGKLDSLVSTFESDHAGRYESLKLDSMNRSEVFPYVLLAYVDGDAGRTAVRDSFRSVLDTDAFGRVEALVWFFEEYLHRFAREAVRASRRSLQQAREDHVDHLEQADEPQHSVEPFDALDWKEPVAMLPVRIETRFVDADPQGGSLHVRPYPDQIQIDAHEDELTEAEYDWGTEFWAQLWFLLHELPSDLSSTTAADVHGGHLSGDVRQPDRLPDDRLRSVVEDLFEQLRNGAFSTDAATRFEEVRDRAWQRGVERFGTERAAYVVHELSPTDGTEYGKHVLAGPDAEYWQSEDPPPAGRPSKSLRFPDVRFRPASWTKPPRARLLPDRWVVYAYWEDQSGPPNLDDSEWSTDWQSAGDRSWRRWDPDREQWVKKITGRAIREPLAVGPAPETVSDGSDPRSGPVEEGMAWMIADDSDDPLEDARNAGMLVSFANPDDGTWTADAGYETLVVTGVRTSGDAKRTARELSDLLDAHHYTDGLAFLEQGTPTNNADEAAGHSSAANPETSAAAEVASPLVPVDRNELPDGLKKLGESDIGADGKLEADGTRLARALGIDTESFAHVENADTLRHLNAGHVNDALWPATWGYYVKNFLVPDSWGTIIGGASTYGGDEPDWYSSAEQDPGTLLLAWLAKYREHFRDHVRGSGPFNTLRIDTQPYGVLPVTPLAIETDKPSTAGQFYADGIKDEVFERDDERFVFRYLEPEDIEDDRFLVHLIEQVAALRSAWLRSATDNVPRVGEGDLNDQQLLDLLSIEANAWTLRRQSWLLGEINATWRLFTDDFDYSPNRFEASQSRQFGGEYKDQEVVEQNLAFVPDLVDPRIRHMRFLGESGLLQDAGDLVDADIKEFLSVIRNLLDDGLYTSFGQTPQSRWLDRLRAIGGYWREENEYLPPSVRDPEMPVYPTPRGQTWERLYEFGALQRYYSLGYIRRNFSTSESVLRKLLHFATLREVASSRIRLGVLYNDVVDMDPDPSAYRGNQTIYQYIGQQLSGEASRLGQHPKLQSVGSPDYGDAIRAAAAPDKPEIDPYVHGFAQHLRHLGTLSPDTLEDLTMETLGLSSHRLDAWQTSIATRQLWNVRDQPSTDEGVYVGAYGYVENLTVESDESGEYLLAPSQNQVTTAAVLRSAHREQSTGQHKDTLAVDLSSERVQRARALLDGVRNGLALSDLLGYRFERRLRERGAESSTPGLMGYLDVFRAKLPSRAGAADRGGNGIPEPNTSPAARRDTVDGLQLYRLWKSGNIPWGAPLPDSDSPAGDEIDEILEEIDDAMDAVNDVLTAEAVHQLSMGNPDRATAALEGLSRGKQLPELEVLQTPREESGVNNRLCVLFGDAEWRNTPGSWEPRYDLRNWAMAKQELIDPDDLGGAGGSGGSGNGDGSDGQMSIGVRHHAEANLNGWVSELLPQPDRIRCPVEYQWSEERAFAAGTFEAPTEPGVVTVRDLEFSPDVLVFTVSAAIDSASADAETAGPTYGWTHGKFHDRDDRSNRQNSMSLVVEADGSTAEYASSTKRAIEVALPGGDATGPETIEGTVEETLSDGFRIRFDKTQSTSPVVQYQAFKTGNNTAIRVGHFRTPAVDTAPATQTVELEYTPPGLSGLGEWFEDPALPPNIELPELLAPSGFEPDHLLLTASNVIEESDETGTAGEERERGSLAGFSHGEVVRTDDGLDQRAVTTAIDPTGTRQHAVSFDADAAITLPYGTGNAITSALSAKVTDLGWDGSSETAQAVLEYDSPEEDVSGGGFPQLVTYVALESPTTEEPVETSHPPAIGQFSMPASAGQTVTETLGFEPACIEFQLCPSLTAVAGGGSDGSAAVRTATGTRGWSHGFATNVTAQGSLAQLSRPVDSSTAMAAQASTTAAITLVHPDDEGSVAGRDIGRVTGIDDDGFTITFPEVHSSQSGNGARPIVLYRAWPSEPDERAFAVETDVTLASVDLSPLDAIALSQVDATPGLSQLERRLQYYLFRHRPESEFRPSIPDDAEIELTFDKTGSSDEAAVSFAQYLELARSIREVIGDGRAVTADDLAHPSEAVGPGYLPPGSADESGTATRLRKRADLVHGRLSDTMSIIENRVDLLDVPDGQRNFCEKVDEIDAALEAFDRTVPAEQLHVVADDLRDEHDPSSGETLLGEFETILETLRAGPTDTDAIDDEVLVEAPGSSSSGSGSGSGTTRTIEAETHLQNQLIAVTVRSLSPSVHFSRQTETVGTDASGTLTATFDFADAVPGTRFSIVARPVELEPPLSSGLAEALEDIVDVEPAGVFRSLREEGVLTASEVETVEAAFERPAFEEFETLSTDERTRLVELLGRDTQFEIFDRLDLGELAERFEAAEQPSPFVATGRVIENETTSESVSLSEVLETRLTLVPRLLWLDRLIDDVQPSNGSVGERLTTALDPQTIDWGRLKTEEKLMNTVAGLTVPSAFGTEDLEAVKRLLALQEVRLQELADVMDGVIEPLARVGLTDLVALTGEKSRPEAQRYWQADCEVGEIWERHCEGSVRARIRNFSRAPGWPGLPAEFQRFAPEFQQLFENSSLDLEHVFIIEAILAEPAAFITATASHLEQSEQLVSDLHELLYHPRRLANRTTPSAIRTRLDAFATQTTREPFLESLEDLFDTAGMRKLGTYLRSDGAGEIEQFVTQAPNMLSDQRSADLQSTFETVGFGSLIGPSLPHFNQTLYEATEANMEQRIGPALAAADLSGSFRTGVLESLRRGLLRASYFGVYGSTPNSAAGGTKQDAQALLQQGQAVLEELSTRDQAAQTTRPQQDGSVDVQLDRLHALLGDEFRVLPPFAPSNPGELRRTFAASDELLNENPYALDTWLQRIARIRERPAEFRQTLTYADLLDLPAGDAHTLTGESRDAIIRRSMTVGQIPHTAGRDTERTEPSWIGLDGVTPSGGDVALAAQFVTEAAGGPVGPAAGSPPMAGLFIDEWVEKIPETERTLGVGLNYDDPDVRAPQSILLAVPPGWKGDPADGWTPTETPTWSMELLRTTLEETTDLVQMRSVDLDALDSLGHVLPALCFAYNEDTAIANRPELFLPDAPSVMLDAFDWISLD